MIILTKKGRLLDEYLAGEKNFQINFCAGFCLEFKKAKASEQK